MYLAVSVGGGICKTNLLMDLFSPHRCTNSTYSNRLESISPYLARQFAPYARTFIDEYIQNNSESESIEVEVGEDGEELVLHGEAEESRVPELFDTEGNKVYSADQVEELLSRCLAAISNRGSISSRYDSTRFSSLLSVFYSYFPRSTVLSNHTPYVSPLCTILLDRF